MELHEVVKFSKLRSIYLTGKKLLTAHTTPNIICRGVDTLTDSNINSMAAGAVMMMTMTATAAAVATAVTMAVTMMVVAAVADAASVASPTTTPKHTTIFPVYSIMEYSAHTQCQ